MLLISQLPNRTLRGWDTEQRSFEGIIKSQESSKLHVRRAGPVGVMGNRRTAQRVWGAADRAEGGSQEL